MLDGTDPGASRGETTVGEAALSAHDALIEFLYRVPLGLIETSLDGTIVMINPKCAQLLMPLCRDGNLSNLFDVLAPFGCDLAALVARQQGSAGVVCESLRVEIPAEGRAPARTLSVGMTKLDDSRLMTVLADATAEAERERLTLFNQLQRAARIDAVTSMPSRQAVIERVQVVLDREPADKDYEFALLFINCDRFKHLNETFGHDVGDEVLALIGGRLRAALRLTDRISQETSEPMAGRVSGDEFVVLVEGLREAAHAASIAQRLVDALSKPYMVEQHQIFTNVSIGITGRQHAPANAEDLLQDASIATSHIAVQGAGRYAVFHPAMRERYIVRRALEHDLRVAIRESRLFVVYQPVVSLCNSASTDCTAGFEALVRWCHPTKGIIAPGVFIELAEEVGLIGSIGEFVLRTACAQHVQWTRELVTGAPRKMAVNVSRAQLASSEFVELLKQVIESTGIHPGHLQLEVTESLAAQGEQIQARLREIKSLGISLALDDFGTGYSSLSSLHMLPVDVVKIDRSFVMLTESSAHHRVLIETTIRVARSLGMSTVAEGIETPGQASIVKKLGCDKAQGYLFSRPMPATEASAWLTANTLAPQLATDSS